MNRYRVELFQERDSTQQMSGYRISLEGDKWIAFFLLFTTGCATTQPTITIKHQFQDNSTSLEVQWKP